MKVTMMAPLAVVFAFSAWAQAPALLTTEELVGDWNISKEFTLAVANAMPAENYDFKPAPQQMSFGGQMLHIAYASVYRFYQLTSSPPPFPLDKPPQGADKTTVLRVLTQAYDYVIALLPKITPQQAAKIFKVDWKGRPEVNGRQMMMNMFVHAAHHRAQAEVYLRLKGIEPPAYTF